MDLAKNTFLKRILGKEKIIYKRSTMKKILILDGNPNKNSLCFSLAEAYLRGSQLQGGEVKKIRIADLHFNPNLQYGYEKRTDLEEDLLNAYKLLQWAEHFVWVHPVWWSGLPAMTKGFIDRLFLPGLTYAPIPHSYKFEQLLKGKTARIIATLDQPTWYYRLIAKAPSEHQLKSSLKLCGVSPIKMTYIGVVKTSTESIRKKWISQIEQLGGKGQ